MAREVTTEPAVVRLTRKAPARMAGQTRYPSRRKAARAMPVQGHTALALALTNASFSPSFPAAK